MSVYRRIPPLNALRAFEAAGRHLSFTKAANELNVTPAAISHQVKGLEEHMGVQLFRRLNKGILLTDAGQAFLPGLREGFDRLASAVVDSQAGDVSRPLTVSVPPSFGAKWLLPRLDDFRRAQPGIDIRVDASTRLVDFTREDVDLSIRFGAGDYPGLQTHCLLPEVLSPICSPQLLEGRHKLSVPADLVHHTLLHVEFHTLDETWPDWAMWLLSAGVTDIDADRGPRFTQSSMAVQAAVEGHGVALGSSVLAADDLAAGRLVKPFELSFPVSFSYYLVYPETAAVTDKLTAFRDWLLAEVEGSCSVAPKQ